MPKNKTQGTTLDDLANMVARGFESSATKDDLKESELRLAGRIDVVEKRLGKVEYQVDEVHDILKRFEESDILNLQKRVHVLEKAVRSLASQIQK